MTGRRGEVVVSLTWKQALLVEHQIEKAGAAWDEPWACQQATQILKRIDKAFIQASIRRRQEDS